MFVCMCAQDLCFMKVHTVNPTMGMLVDSNKIIRIGFSVYFHKTEIIVHNGKTVSGAG